MKKKSQEYHTQNDRLRYIFSKKLRMEIHAKFLL